jgi:alcohol dehydrogenase (NADP+)
MSSNSKTASQSAQHRILSLTNHFKNPLNPADDLQKAKMSGTDYKFEGWMGLDKNAEGNMVWQEFTPKTWEETDVDIKISHCGICGSDLHTLRSGWVSFLSTYE